jgi:hypothetical protein
MFILANNKIDKWLIWWAECYFGGLAPGLNNGLMVNFGYPMDYPQVRFNIQIHALFISDRIRVYPTGQKIYPYLNLSGQISARYPNPRIKLSSLCAAHGSLRGPNAHRRSRRVEHSIDHAQIYATKTKLRLTVPTRLHIIEDSELTSSICPEELV